MTPYQTSGFEGDATPRSDEASRARRSDLLLLRLAVVLTIGNGLLYLDSGDLVALGALAVSVLAIGLCAFALGLGRALR